MSDFVPHRPKQERPTACRIRNRGFIGDLGDFDPYDSTHLFREQLKELGFASREIRRGDVTDEQIEELLKASEPIPAIPGRIQRRKEQSKVVKARL
jgi:hypothetical protein